MVVFELWAFIVEINQLLPFLGYHTWPPVGAVRTTDSDYPSAAPTTQSSHSLRAPLLSILSSMPKYVHFNLNMIWLRLSLIEDNITIQYVFNPYKVLIIF